MPGRSWIRFSRLPAGFAGPDPDRRHALFLCEDFGRPRNESVRFLRKWTPPLLVRAVLANFSQQGADKTHLLRKDLRSLRQPVLIIFDSYEDVVENKTVADWLCQQLFNEIETALGLAVIVAGQRVPDSASAFWRELARHLQVEPITELEHWEAWIERRYPSFRQKGVDLPTVLMIAHGNPAVIATSCEAVAKS
jgi:hypothetical protein